MTRQRNALRNAMHDAGIPYLEIPELTEQNYPENFMLFGELVHPNQRGHRLMEVRLLEFLARREMLWDLAVPELNIDQRHPGASRSSIAMPVFSASLRLRSTITAVAKYHRPTRPTARVWGPQSSSRAVVVLLHGGRSVLD